MKRDERIFIAREGKVRTIQTGFSWIAFFWSPLFPALFNKDWKWVVITLGVGVLIGIARLGPQEAGMLYLVYMLFFAFMYHSLYEKGLRKAGWTDATREEIAEATKAG